MFQLMVGKLPFRDEPFSTWDLAFEAAQAVARFYPVAVLRIVRVGMKSKTVYVDDEPVRNGRQQPDPDSPWDETVH